MQIILKKYHKGLGEKNEVVDVKPGYARNYLIPQGIAILATKTNLKILAENERQAAHRQEHILGEARKKAEELEGTKLTIETLAGPDGKLFGSVTPLMVAKQLEEKGFDVERQRINFESAIKETGTYKAIIDLQKDVKATIEIDVVAVEKD